MTSPSGVRFLIQPLGKPLYQFEFIEKCMCDDPEYRIDRNTEYHAQHAAKFGCHQGYNKYFEWMGANTF